MKRDYSAIKDAQTGVHRAVLWPIFVLLVVMPCMVFFQCLYKAQLQYRKIRDYQPIPAKIVSAEVTISKNSKGRIHYHPTLKYEYAIGDEMYQCDRVAPLNESSSQDWASEIVRRFPAGKDCTAYVNPTRHGEAFLIRSYSFEPYFEMLMMVWVVTSISFLMLMLPLAEAGIPKPLGRSSFQITPQLGSVRKLNTARLCTGIWYVGGLVPVAHYLLQVPAPHPPAALKCFAVFGLMGLIPAGIWFHQWRRNQYLNEARLNVDRVPIISGREFAFAVSQCARRTIQVEQTRLILRCLGSIGSNRSEVLYEAVVAESRNRVLHDGEDVELSGVITIPADQPATGRDVSGKFRRIDWVMRWETRLLQGGNYVSVFPLEVQASSCEGERAGAQDISRPLVKVEALDAEHRGRILTRRNIFVAYLIALSPLAVCFLALGLSANFYLSVFPGDGSSQPFLKVPRSEGICLLVASAILAVVSMVVGIACSDRMYRWFILSIAKKEIARRPGALAGPEAASVFVEVIPRRNWHRQMWENAADLGFLKFDASRREILFEGDHERYRITADALKSCELEKSFLGPGAKDNASGIWLVVLRGNGIAGKWEAPICIRSGASVLFQSKRRHKEALRLQQEIRATLSVC